MTIDVGKFKIENLGHLQYYVIDRHGNNILIMLIICPQIVLRINCLSTEFSSQKGVKGLPLHVVIDIYEDLENETAEPVHRAYCRVKIFRDKVSICFLNSLHAEMVCTLLGFSAKLYPWLCTFPVYCLVRVAKLSTQPLRTSV